ncbi:MAG: hypothetical protein LBN23_05195 [Paludibacter sp.]|jgi:hypothetical protein|nr:hypothetical protein [Paludibacter sp.]
MNKKFLSALVFLSIISFAQAVSAQSQSSITIWGQGNYGNWWQTNNESLKPKNVSGGGGGIGYEWWHKALILGIGVEYTSHKMNIDYGDYTHRIDSLYDEDGDMYRGNWYYTNIKDKINYANINIPISVGLQNKKFYAIASGKIGINVSGTTDIVYGRRSTGTYWDKFTSTYFPEEYYDFKDMPPHWFLNKRYEKVQNIRFNTAFSGSLEAGIKFPVQDRLNKKPVTFRLGLFVDYTINNKIVPHTNPFVYNELPASLEQLTFPYQSPVLDNTLLSDPTYKSVVTPLVGGIKFTILFRLKGKDPCNCEFD